MKEGSRSGVEWWMQFTVYEGATFILVRISLYRRPRLRRAGREASDMCWMRGRRRLLAYGFNSSSNAFVSLRSAVSKPSVNQL